MSDIFNTPRGAWPHKTFLDELLQRLKEAKGSTNGTLTDVVCSRGVVNHIRFALLATPADQVPSQLRSLTFHDVQSFDDAMRLARDLRTKGRTPYILGFNQGEPDCDTPVVVAGGEPPI